MHNKTQFPLSTSLFNLTPTQVALDRTPFTKFYLSHCLANTIILQHKFVASLNLFVVFGSRTFGTLAPATQISVDVPT